MKERIKKKFLTTISGLTAFNIDSKEFSKKCSKKFACSCNAVDADSVQVQGDISEALYDFLEKEYHIEDKLVLDSE